MKNLKMAQKLILGFGSVTLLVCLLGYMSWSALGSSAASIMKVANAYIPASDITSTALDDIRLIRYQLRQYEFFGKKEDFVEADKLLKSMHEEFERLRIIAVANPELIAITKALRDFPPLFKGYSDGAHTTDKALDNATTLLKNMLSSAAAAENALKELEHSIQEVQKSYYELKDTDSMLRTSNNMHLVGEVALDFKEIRRLYANARPTFDVNVRESIDKLGVTALSNLSALEKGIVRQHIKVLSQNAEAAMKSYLADMARLIRGWEEIQTASQARRDFSARLVTLLEELNTATNNDSVNYAQNADHQADVANIRVIATTAGVVVLSIILALVITRAVTVPLGRSVRFAQSVAAGNLDDVLHVQSRDEIGKLADALRSMVASLKSKICEANEQASQASQMEGEAKSAMAEAQRAQAAAENAKREGMLAAAHQLEDIVAVVSSASSQLAAHVNESEKGAAIAAERLTDTATAMEEMNATVLEVARSAGNAAHTSNDAKTKAEHGASIVESVVKCIYDVEQQSTRLKTDMLQLGQQAESIGTIMNVISDIADQTNLLALNAAIEAARAGEAGRGFAVVADEVRKLAEKTMHATVEVGDAIRGVQQSADMNMKGVDASSQIIGQATELVRQAGASLKEIVILVDNSADQVRTIATAAEEQSATSEEINRSLGTVSNASSDTARAMAEAAQAVSDLSQQAQNLSRLIDEMKV